MGHQYLEIFVDLVTASRICSGSLLISVGFCRQVDVPDLTNSFIVSSKKEVECIITTQFFSFASLYISIKHSRPGHDRHMYVKKNKIRNSIYLSQLVERIFAVYGLKAQRAFEHIFYCFVEKNLSSSSSSMIIKKIPKYFVFFIPIA